MSKLGTVHGYGLRSAQPTPNANQEGLLYLVSDEDVMERWSGSAWVQVAINAAPDEVPAGEMKLYRPGGTSEFTSSTTLNNAARLYDGRWWGTAYLADFGSDAQWVKLDMQSVRTLMRTDLYTYLNDDRAYKDLKFEVSEDDVTYKTVYDAGTYVHQSRHPLVVDLQRMQGRYIKVSMNGNTINAGNHIDEWQVYYWEAFP